MNSVQTDQKFLRKSTLFTFAGSALKVAAPVLTIVVARVFGKEIFGIYVSTQLLILSLSRVAVIGLDKGMLRYIPQNRVCGRPEHEGIIESLWRTLFFALVISVVMWGGAAFDLQRITTGLAMLSSAEISLYVLSIIPYTSLLLFAASSEGNRRPQYKIFINEFAVTTLAPVIALALHFTGFQDKLALPLGFFVSNLFGVITYIFLINRQFTQIRWFIKDKIPSELLKFSIPLGVTEIVASFLLRMDLWMVLALIGPEAAGVYAVMVTISNGLKTVRSSYDPILQPVVAGMSKERLDTDLKPVFSYCVSMVTLIQLTIGFFIVLFPEQTMMIAGKSFVTDENPVAVLGILIIGNLINGFFGLTGSVINALGKSRFMLFMNMVSLVFATIMNRMCIPIFGIAGAAISSMAYQILQNVWMCLYLRKMGYWPFRLNLLIQIAWILLLIISYVVLNTVWAPSLWIKAAIYVGIILLIVLTFFKQGLAGEMGSRKKKKS
ncbi:polysaccharide biosynthesis C-terminal domain-containing protein [Fibrobacter sp. UWH1]|uniref:oligosaccharide flippase family protein n=1 Tax=Fibrobacter sp. UWH1 TaxID=1964354 RepID=UPI000B524AE8|nr:polysaccharide biosynthesis C-terminal domain-containing protein [Fibrobacter sp. UWH1]OWV16225.1 hypothetical protein B7992_03250 [Fibrobacter sp. UWH1]